jgi:hypothetical protein
VQTVYIHVRAVEKDGRLDWVGIADPWRGRRVTVRERRSVCVCVCVRFTCRVSVRQEGRLGGGEWVWAVCRGDALPINAVRRGRERDVASGVV